MILILNVLLERVPEILIPKIYENIREFSEKKNQRETFLESILDPTFHLKFTRKKKKKKTKKNGPANY